MDVCLLHVEGIHDDGSEDEVKMKMETEYAYDGYHAVQHSPSAYKQILSVFGTQS
jgi:hypothetical protein